MSSLQTNTRREEAAEWFAALQSDLSLSDIRRWEQWIADLDNRASFDALCAVWDRAKDVKLLPLPDAQTIADDAYDGSESIDEWLEARSRQALKTSDASDVSNASDVSGAASVDHGADRFGPLRPGRRAFAVAAGMAVLAVAWIFYPGIGNGPLHYETNVAQHRTVELPDGSELLLGAETSLWVAYARDRRTVLLDRGEVLIHVVPQRRRPFNVLAGNGVITAVGTRFVVQRNPERVTVTVTEGVVRVEPRVSQIVDGIVQPTIDVQPPPVIATLNVGRRVSYDESGDLTAVQRVDPENAAAWREGRLRYRDELLRDVISDVNRYSRREIILAEDAADTLNYTGTVFQDDIDDWIDGLPGIFPLEIVEADSEHVLLRKRHTD